MSPLIEFYKGNGTDSEGRSLSEIWAFRHDQWEDRHDFIQWLFPLREPSQFNPDAPLLTDGDVALFHADAPLQENLKRSFGLFLAFLGLRLEGDQVVRTSEGERNRVFDHPNHNWLRITRVLTSIRILGLETECRAFFSFLNQLHDEDRSGATTESFRYWREAAGADRGGCGHLRTVPEVRVSAPQKDFKDNAAVDWERRQDGPSDRR